MLSRQILLYGLVLGGCKTAAPAGDSAIDKAAEKTAECSILLSVEREDAGGNWFLHAVAINTTDQKLQLDLPGRCPGGAVDFEGLGAGYDYYGTCAMGPCAAREVSRIELPPGESVRLATAVVNPRGRGCQPALDAKSHSVSFSLPLKTPIQGLCSEPLRIDHKLE